MNKKNNDSIIYQIVKDYRFLSTLFILFALVLSSYFVPDSVKKVIWIVLEVFVIIWWFFWYIFIWNLSKNKKDKLIWLVVATPVLTYPLIFSILFLSGEIFNFDYIKIFTLLTKDYLNSLFITIYWAILWVFVWFYLDEDWKTNKSRIYKNNIVWILFLMLFYTIFSLVFNYNLK